MSNGKPEGLIRPSRGEAGTRLVYFTCVAQVGHATTVGAKGTRSCHENSTKKKWL